jgi:hypothetical protein
MPLGPALALRVSCLSDSSAGAPFLAQPKVGSFPRGPGFLPVFCSLVSPAEGREPEAFSPFALTLWLASPRRRSRVRAVCSFVAWVPRRPPGPNSRPEPLPPVDPRPFPFPIPGPKAAVSNGTDSSASVAPPVPHQLRSRVRPVCSFVAGGFPTHFVGAASLCIFCSSGSPAEGREPEAFSSVAQGAPRLSRGPWGFSRSNPAPAGAPPFAIRTVGSRIRWLRRFGFTLIPSRTLAYDKIPPHQTRIRHEQGQTRSAQNLPGIRQAHVHERARRKLHRGPPHD